MAKILCATSGLTGMLNASFELVTQLQSDGHEVIYATPKPVGKRVEAQGIHYIQLPEITALSDDDIPKYKGPFRKINRWVYKIRHRKARQEKGLAIIQPTAFQNLLSTIQPDLILLDVELHEYIITANAAPIPLVLLSQWFSLWRRPGLPYLLHDTIPGQGWSGSRFAIWLSWCKIRVKRWWIFAKKRLLGGGTDRRSLLFALARENNFPLSYIRENNWPGPFTYGTLPVLNMTMAELEFPHSPRPNAFYVGIMVRENRKEITSIKDEDKLQDAFAYQNRTGATLIYGSVSTLKAGDLSFIKKIMAAVADQQEWMLIIGLGGLIDQETLGELPKNVFAFSYVPQLRVLSKAQLSINHGGIHTINECIHYGVPMLIYSGKRSDQNGCAARIAYHKLGIMADKDKDGVAEIRQNIQEVLENSEYRKKTEAINAVNQDYKKHRILEKQIEKFLQT